ncbi:MAG: Glutathione S-transferase [Burkholderiaceae bacterium]|jgi:glutathione S-transferase|nr:MAG: Glutathione S-transferase [Burkholderiaceae bacterium]
MLRLHHYPGSASMAPQILLEEIGAPFELVLVDRAQGVQKTQQYLRLNPNGLIPTLTDGDLVLYEAAAICLHLCDRYPEAQLAPALGTEQRAQFYKWLVWLTNTLQATLIVYFYPERWVNAGNSAGVSQVRAHAESRVRVLVDLLEREFAASNGPWLLGERYSAVDAYAFMLCRWTRNFHRPARARAYLGPYLERVLERPAVQRAMKAAAISPPWF